MKIKNVARESFSTGRATQKKRNFAVGLRVFRQVVIESDSVLLIVTEIFAHRARSVRRDVLKRSGLRSGRGDDDGVIHRSGIGENFNDLRDGRALLPDRTVDANHPLALLVDDGIENDGGFSGLAVADDQLALAAADGDHRIDSLDAGL